MTSLNIRTIWSLLSPQERRRSAVLMALDIVISVADILFLSLLLYVIKSYSGGGAKPELMPVLVFFVLFSMKNLAGFLVYRAQIKLLYQVASRLSARRLLQYLEGDWSGYAGTDPSVQIRAISYQPLEFCQHVLGGLQQIFTQMVLILLTVAAILLYNAKLFLLLLLILLPPVCLVFYLVRKKAASIGRQARASSEQSLQHLQEALSGFVESNIYQKNELFLDRYVRDQDRFNRHIAGHSIAQGIPSRMIEVFALMGIVLLILINRWSGNGDSLITIGVFVAAAYKIIPGIVKILTLSGQISTYAFTIDSLVGMAANGTVANDTAVNGMEKHPADKEKIRSVDFRDVRFAYGERLVLDGQDLCIQPGEMVGIAGASGRGKTTILHLLLGFLQPDSGAIRINGTLTGAAGRQRFWHDIAYVKQQPFLIGDSVLQNITLGEKRYDETRLKEVLAIAGLAGIVDAYPGKWHRPISGNGRDISGGQRQRIAIARALYKDAGFIILDEPFNELDEASELALLGHFKQLAAEGKTIVLITHNQKSLSFCHKIVSLDERRS